MSLAAFDTLPPIVRRASDADQSRAHDALRYARVHDAFGHQLHTGLAMLFLALVPLTTAPKDFAFVLLLIWTLVRLPHTWRSYLTLRFRPVVIALTAWAAWFGLSMTWSADPAQGFDEFGALRVLVVPLLLWPVLDRAPWLIAATLAGVLAHNIIQLLQELGVMAIPRGEQGRVRGLIHPGKGGAWCLAAVLWTLFAVIHGRRLLRWGSLALMLLAFGGVVASGSRGTWVAAAVAIPAALAVTAARRPSARRTIAIIALVGVFGCGATWLIARHRVQPRVEQAITEVRDAREHGVYWTSAGLRVALWHWAIELFRSHPIAGVGAGGFASAAQALPSFDKACANTHSLTLAEAMRALPDSAAPSRLVLTRAERITDRRIAYLKRDHAHSTPLHVLAQQGLIGFGLLATALGLLIIRCWNDRRDHLYVDASLFILIAWLVGSCFDCYELNGNQLGLLAVLVALTLPCRAAIRLRWPARDPGEAA